MQIKFLTIYGSPIHGASAMEAQCKLLEFWQKAIMHNQISFIQNAKVNFTDYSFDEYAEFAREKLIKEINYKTSYNLNGKQFWQAFGKRYDVFEELYNDLAVDHRLMELTITIEEY